MWRVEREREREYVPPELFDFYAESNTLAREMQRSFRACHRQFEFQYVLTRMDKQIAESTYDHHQMSLQPLYEQVQILP